MLTKEKIIEVLSKTEPVFIEDLAYLLGIEDISKTDLFELVRELEQQGQLIYTKKNKITTTLNMKLISGTFIFSYDTGLIKVGENQVKIPVEKMGGALPFDTVLVKLSKSGQFGEVYKVIKKAEALFTGVLKKKNGVYNFILSKGKFLYKTIVANKFLNGAKNNDKVKIQIVSFSIREGFLAKVVKVFGNAYTKDANYLAILDANDIITEFSPQTIDDANNKTKEIIDEKVLINRLDLRNEAIFTIDPHDALDLDDAVSIEKTENGYKLGVHIADVSHFVVSGCPLDKEAILRGTSVYFADKVVPMLPEQLSNGVCSLNEKVDRLAMSVIMELDQNGNVKDFIIKDSIIRSVKKCSYRDINSLISKTNDEELAKSYEAVLPYLDLMLELAEKLRKKRFARGSLDFELNESKVILDQNGVPTEIINRVRGESEKIIEEFMLLANETTAKFVFFQELPYIYRIHEKPDIDKINNLIKVVRLLGYSAKSIKNGIHPAQLQKIISHFMNTKYEKVISMLSLRSLAKAKYSQICLGHFGLSLEYYCHFTSPIRRYPDLACHRILKYIINGEMTENKQNNLKNFVVDASLSSSQAEVRALTAERAIEDMYKAWYMSLRIGQSFDGVISSVTSFGFYVELENTVEGLVRVSDLIDDYYVFNQDRLCLVGERTKRVYNIGDQIKIICTAADISTGQIDFTPF